MNLTPEETNYFFIDTVGRNIDNMVWLDQTVLVDASLLLPKFSEDCNWVKQRLGDDGTNLLSTVYKNKGACRYVEPHICRTEYNQ